MPLRLPVEEFPPVVEIESIPPTNSIFLLEGIPARNRTNISKDDTVSSFSLYIVKGFLYNLNLARLLRRIFLYDTDSFFNEVMSWLSGVTCFLGPLLLLCNPVHVLQRAGVSIFQIK